MMQTMKVKNRREVFSFYKMCVSPFHVTQESGDSERCKLQVLPSQMSRRPHLQEGHQYSKISFKTLLVHLSINTHMCDGVNIGLMGPPLKKLFITLSIYLDVNNFDPF